MMERHLKSFKAFARQCACHDGPMVEGYMVYQTLMYMHLYIRLYIPKLVVDINVSLIWDVHSNNKFKRKVLLGKGRMRKVKCNYMVEIYNTFNYLFFYISYIFNL